MSTRHSVRTLIREEWASLRPLGKRVKSPGPEFGKTGLAVVSERRQGQALRNRDKS